MKKILALSLLVLVALYVLKLMVYQPYMWKKAIASPEHRLQSGSYIFTTSMEHNGSQSRERAYFIFKVVEIEGDHVRLAVVRQLSPPNQPLSAFSTTKDEYASLKDGVRDLTVTKIAQADLYGKEASHTLNDRLLAKYPSLNSSRYYFEDDTELRTEAAANPATVMEAEAYLRLVFSKAEIVANGKLVPWVLNNSPTPQLAPGLSKQIDVIVN
ncbi:hypothetical protein SAMN05428959_1011319 [Duganella sp. CF517]|uniref:hypothetical protein n=1 Tax=Duganella sp. CF517 TaxID=1881038 RepID=UPI0008B8B163|nr:hypothetical protein [Duganella sp. CF517]SEN35300.1 hypothetical protein SAMN05428959_1011319 [Duganella sp. CF517]